MAIVHGFDGLFEADGDEQAEDDGGDVDEEVAPGAGGVVSGVDVEHGCGLLWDRVGGGRGDGLLRRDGGSFEHSVGFGHKSTRDRRRLEEKVREEGNYCL
jgi:hypothetical protein